MISLGSFSAIAASRKSFCISTREKVIEDGRNGCIVLFSSLVEKQLLENDRRLMVAKVIRVAKR